MTQTVPSVAPGVRLRHGSIGASLWMTQTDPSVAPSVRSRHGSASRARRTAPDPRLLPVTQSVPSSPPGRRFALRERHRLASGDANGSVWRSIRAFMLRERTATDPRPVSGDVNGSVRRPARTFPSRERQRPVSDDVNGSFRRPGRPFMSPECAARTARRTLPDPSPFPVTQRAPSRAPRVRFRHGSASAPFRMTQTDPSVAPGDRLRHRSASRAPRGARCRIRVRFP